MNDPEVGYIGSRGDNGFLQIERRHFEGWPSTRTFDIYIVEGSRADLISAHLCSDENFPSGKKRVHYGGVRAFSWSVRLIKGGRYSLVLQSPVGSQRAICEHLASGRHLAAASIAVAERLKSQEEERAAEVHAPAAMDLTLALLDRIRKS